MLRIARNDGARFFPAHPGSFQSRREHPDWIQIQRELAMSDSVTLSALSSAVAGIVATTAPAIVSVHSHRARASGFVWKPGFVVTADEALADEGEVSIKL